MSEVIFGTRQIGGPPSYKEIDISEGKKILQYAYEKGIRTFDTAPIYGNGQSERVLGEFLEENQIRKQCKIITKFGFQITQNNPIFDFSREGIIKQLEGSLKRLCTDYIDIYLLHIPQDSLNASEIIETLNHLKDNGKIKAYGVCNMYTQQLSTFLKHRDSQIEYIQDFYNILEKKAENLIFPYMKQQKFLAYGPLYRGLLTDIAPRTLLEKEEDAINRLLKHSGLVSLLRQKAIYQEVAKRKGLSLEQLAIDFLQKNQKVDAILFGTTNKEHLDTFLKYIH